jgi:hypothetical protein
MRLGEAHGAPKLTEVLTQISVPWFELAQGKHVRIVAAAAGIDVADLSFDTGVISERSVILRGEQLRRRQWSLHSGRRACPTCLAADRTMVTGVRLPRSWHRTWWDVQPVTVCPVHNHLLLLSCRECGSEFDFKSTAVGRCPNGHPIESATTDVVDGCTGDAYIVGRLGGCPRLSNTVLDSGQLGEAIEVLEIVGATALGGHRPSPSRSFERHAILRAGFSIFDDWPGAFDTLLEGLLVGSKTGLGRWGAAAAYGPLHGRLQELQDGKIASVVKGRVRRHAAANGVAISKPVFGVTMPTEEVFSLRQAAERLHMGFDRTRKELGKHGLLPKSTRRGTPIRVSAASVGAIISRRTPAIGVVQLSRRLSIGRTQARSLAKADLLDGARGPFPEEAAEILIGKMVRSASAKFDRTGTTALPKGCQSARCKIEAAVSAILNGTLPVVGYKPGLGLSGVFVQTSALRSIGKTERGVMTIDDAAEELNVKWEVLRDLIGLKALDGDATGVTPIALAKFRRDFIACARLAEACGVRSRTLIKSLTEMGLTPAAAPPHCRQVFYRRRDLLRVAAIRSRLPQAHQYLRRQSA